ncbi:hypothetical protein ATE67_14235 [Sphingopyxis sp. H050]|jgi:DNA-binding response OmpR family regulator|uniref:hypothetical protein n=1 Tax=Sphingopyxis sp. H050 TaxID=1759072 RepID=UPI00073637D1|nr:hypothetical protein [Sphingopyxis sp. H050]KTE19784.1 hypothetical protein ATE67_14235 [Sphingopyxis sp. H050]
MDQTIGLRVSDPALLSSLRFALALDGFVICEDSEADTKAGCLVVDQDYRDGGIAWLAEARASGLSVPALLLVTNPDRRTRAAGTAIAARLVDKPLQGDELAEALTSILTHRPAA